VGVFVYQQIEMETRSFYGAKTSRFGRHLRYFVSQAVPDDGNCSDVEDVDTEEDGNLDDNRDPTTADDSSSDDDGDGETTETSEYSESESETVADGWSNIYRDSRLPKNFDAYHGPFVTLPSDAPAYDFFDLLFPASIWERMVTESSRYAQQKCRLKGDDITVQEMKAFVGLVLAMGIHVLPRIENYWDRHWVLAVPQFGQIMTSKRFSYLWSNMHLVENGTNPPVTDPEHDRLFKVRPLLSKLQDTFAESYYPGQNVAVDESMVRFKGRCCMKQYMPLKPIKRGFKIWCASCSCCGYVKAFQMYTGKEKHADTDKGLAHRVVTELVVPYFSHRNHIIYMDNFFTSLPLFDDLAKSGIFACGTYKSNRVGFPKELGDKKLVKTLKRGDAIARYKGRTTALVWKDKKPVYVASSAHVPSTTAVNRKNADGTIVQVSCPEIVSQYNRYMGGVDLTDQLKGTYGINRKSKRWWLRLLWHFVDLAVTNAYILYRHSYIADHHPPMVYRPDDQLQFRCKLIDQLVNHFSSRKQHGRPVKSPVVSLVPSRHKIADLRSLGVKKGRCEFCCVGPYKTSSVRRETQFGCPKCKVRLCPVTCWAAYHSKFQPQQ